MKFVDEAEMIGRIHIYVLIATIVISWGIIFGINIKAIYERYKKPTMKERLEKIISEIKYPNDDITSPERGLNIELVSGGRTDSLPQRVKTRIRSSSVPKRNVKRKPVVYVRKDKIVIRQNITKNITFNKKIKV